MNRKVSGTSLMMLLLQVQVFYGRGDVRLLDHDKVYQVITELIKEGKPEADAQSYKQFVSAVLMTEKEIAGFNGDLERFKNRKGVYLNDDSQSDTGLRHGEDKLLEDKNMKNFIKALKKYQNDNNDGTPPILLLFSYYIPCDQSHHTNPTECALHLKGWVDDTNKREKTIQLFVSFVRVFEKLDDPGVMEDFTHLDNAVRYLMSPDICLTYLVPKQIPDNELIPDVNLRMNPKDLSLSPCLEREGMVSHNLYTKHLFDRYAANRPDHIAQLILFNHLQRFLAGCIGTRSSRIIEFAVNFAFRSCIQEDEQPSSGPPLYCRNEQGPLRGDVDRSGNRQKLYNCLFDEWVDKLGRFQSRNCRGGDPLGIVKVGVRTAVQDGASVGYPSGEAHGAKWKSIRSYWNVHFDMPDARVVRCQNRALPQFLCTTYPSSSPESSSRLRSRSRSRERYRSRSRSPIYENRV